MTTQVPSLATRCHVIPAIVGIDLLEPQAKINSLLYKLLLFMALYLSNKKVTDTVGYYKGNEIPNERWSKYWERRDEAKGAVTRLCYPAENNANLMQYFLLHH